MCDAIAFVEAHRTLALGGGATSRVDPVHAAREKAARVGISLKGSVLASDAFFPFPDGVEEATVEIVWDPPWHQSMITPEGRRLLGLE